ncbi:flagellar type III secretion system protein FliR [Ruminiclostridium herbifermentans]|uniref:Flagellar biosynthetic protein FliR n=1 Tax=Ruminiclostridium herbifermentans TaxID=2488810 RepID=A0A4U7JJK9_9FIRM|nr:flagellar biosynthetic protein FliR [Ruminiclostridium herbifermentans]QNU68402.1 flagellar type III secretion system protein FliR [Ruminiclostridium herbifermentans]
MQIPLGMLLNSVELFLLIFVRMTGLFVIAPIFGRNMPTYVKIGIALGTSILMASVVKVDHVVEINGYLLYAFYIIKEFIVGVVIGFVAYALFTSIYVAGQIIDMQIGFGMVNVFDPITNIQVPITANLYYMVAMLIFLATNGHHILIKALYQSFKLVPITSAGIGPNMKDNVLEVFQQMFSIGFKIAAPILAAILIADVVLGIISKTIPQMNVFVLGMPLKILVGLILIMITIPAFIYIVTMISDKMNIGIFKFLKDMGSNP